MLSPTFIQKVQQYYSSPNKDLFLELNEYQQQADAWNSVQYLQDQNPYLKAFAISTIKYKCKFGLSTLAEEHQKQLLEQLIQIRCFDAVALILAHHIDWLEHCPNIPDILSECALIESFPPIQLSKYLAILAPHPLGLDTIGRLLHKSSISLDSLSPFVDQAISLSNFLFLTEISAIYFNSDQLLLKLSQFATQVNYSQLENEDLLDFIYMCVELGESNVSLLCKNPQKYSQFWQLLIQISGLPVLHTLLFWSYISEKQHTRNDFFLSIYGDLLNTIFPSICYPDTTDNQQLEDFRQHRRDLSELLSFCFRELQDSFFSIIHQFQGNPIYAEAQYYCIRSVGYDLLSTQPYPHLNVILQDQQFHDNPRVVYAKCLSTQSITPYFKNDSEWLSTALKWIEDCALIMGKDPKMMNAVLRSLSFLLSDAGNLSTQTNTPASTANSDISNKVSMDMMIQSFQLSWDIKHKEGLSNFCRCSQYLMHRTEFLTMINSIVNEMLNHITDEPYSVLFLGLFIQFIDHELSLQIVQKVLSLELPRNVFLAKFYKSAPRHAQSLHDLKTLVHQLMGLPVFKGQLHALEVIIVQGYCKLNTDELDEWNKLSLQLFEHLLTVQIDESELENLFDFFQMLFHSHYEIYYNCNAELLHHFISSCVPLIVKQTEIPENVGNVIDWLLCLVEIIDATVNDLQHIKYANTWSNIKFPDLLRNMILKGFIHVLPILMFSSNLEKFPTMHLRELSVIMMVVCKNCDMNELKVEFDKCYEESSPFNGYKVQMKIFAADMMSKAQTIIENARIQTEAVGVQRELRRGVTSILAIIRTQRQWYATIQQ
eukprot:NODE_273_length_12179_cov_0.492632.p1 type:complete len:826 gc:universal NODE_273_length_12179_cov_0.492632:5786-3309(-)